MNDYVLAKNFIAYIKICYKYGILAKWITNIKYLKDKERYTLYTKWHIYNHDKYRPYKVNIF